MVKNLEEILALLPKAKVLSGTTAKEITDITIDSRTVQQGSLFVCIKGVHTDGHNYIDKAVAAGAVAVLVEEDTKPRDGLTVVKVSSSEEAMTAIAPFFYDYPGKKLRMIGVTGTNGKTTSTNIIRMILRKAGFKVGLIGTINIMIEDKIETSHNTTPDVVDLQRNLYRMVQAGCDYVVMEVSSHALALNRVAGIEFDVAALTNITQDHLDFHGTMENYREAKALLFTNLHKGNKPNKTAVFNMDDPSSKIIMDRTKTKVITYGKGDTNDIYPLSFTVGAKHMKLNLHTPDGDMDLLLHITGEFNVYNIMTAVGVAIAEKIDPTVIMSCLDGFTGVKGRFQLVEAGQPFTVIVDYAHTPDGLDNVLRTSRQITKGKLWVVFGCGGDRDNKKRPIMGRIALELADKLVVTSDNPRSEDPEVIISDIEKGLAGAPATKEIHKITDRREGIYFALSHAAADDVIMIAGKGHENYQILGDKTIHFDDCEVVRDYFKKGN
ncbi:MAG: UDP-N-acetylmuramoyl-L-alanyl-D-glutamate--2,6-diaminopimelate ligase [Acidaminococcaceae bacterium]|jgi:UDP-N-acetylmuramyl-tripeptide synthetase|nr:UDP-N-acetylmuramoyl-L-alanyl-D-glutamate--2,6-diaminopimelate ligase [Acidaminococcaceae bacterium]MCI2110560.1 UDP-N-acetylmuramoyl-L-alanyl-D-glutamate--2,6-diaminopimelate ligase [Acidaminococcaceae bacterium]